MKTLSLASVSLLLATTAMAQPATSTAPAAGATGGPGTPPISGTMPDASMTPGAAPGIATPNPNPGTGRGPIAGNQTGSSATNGDHNDAISTSSNHASQPAHGANSYTAAQARRRLESHGFQNVSGLQKDKDGVWRGKGMKSGQQVSVWLDYRGNAGQQ